MATTQLETSEAVPGTSGRALGSEFAIDDGQNAPSTAVHALEKWNSPRHNIPRLMATFWSFVVSGANDAAYGVCILSCRWGFNGDIVCTDRYRL